MSTNHFEKYLELRIKHPQFYYHSFNYQFKDHSFFVEFNFSIGDDYFFKPKHSIQIPHHLNWQDIDKKELDQLVFHLGMVEVVSYWKASCSPQLIIKPFKLNTEQIDWWKKLYYQGLGEFYYLNNIETNMIDFVDIICESDRDLERFDPEVLEERVMIPVGGGKDSVVSLELIKNNGFQIIPMVVNPRGASKESIINAGFTLEESILTKRSIDPQLLELNKLGYLNGHTPFSAMLAFLSLLSSRLMGIKYIALSNESSANEATVVGTEINHQYSKSYEFERDFRNYYKKYLNKNQEYFSFLRPLSEIQIGCLFSKFTEHHFSFKSCNVGSKKDVWCGECSKCLFTYVLLSPFISAKKMESIFGKSLLNDKGLSPILSELRGQAETKPFECVGTVSEVELALSHAKVGFQKDELMRGIKIAAQQDQLLEALKDWNEIHYLPKSFESILQEYLMKC